MARSTLSFYVEREPKLLRLKSCKLFSPVLSNLLCFPGQSQRFLVDHKKPFSILLSKIFVGPFFHIVFLLTVKYKFLFLNIRF